jgi:hypothetical protein
VATLRASAQFLDDEGNEQLVDDEEGDWRAYDAAYQAGRQFERYAVACLRAHVLADQSPPTTQPHRWTPLYPRVVPVVPVQPRPKPAAAPPTTQPAERESSAAPGHSAGPFEHAGHALAPPVEPEPTVPLRQRLKH